ncbi:MAG: M48 family metalloprotease, partial [Terracidiphilus sp.]
MSMKTVFAAALTAALSLAALPVCHGQWGSIQKMGPEVHVQVHAETTGEVSISVWDSDGGRELVPVLAEVVHCQSVTRQDPMETNEIHCSRALCRNGLALEGVIDLAPIARRLSASDEIQLWVDHPRLGFGSSSLAMQELGGPMRAIATARFEAGSAPAPVHFRFGYRPDQLAGATLPLLALALALAVLAAVLAHIGVAGLNRSVVLLGTILWMGAASQLQAGALVHILLYGNPLAPLAALLVEFWPPLVCVAAGIALGSRKQDGRNLTGRFSEVFWGFAVIPLLLTSAIGALPRMMDQDWLAAAPWLIAAPLFVLLRRAWIRSTAGASVCPLSEGELKERIAVLVGRAGRPPIKVFISFSTRSQAATAFTLPGKSIYLTAPLVSSLSKREVDAIAAHELSHFSYSGRGQWMALGLAMVLFETPVSVLLLSLPGGLFMALLALLTVLFAALHGVRKREFAADANAAALTGDPRAMISGLARVARSNKILLEMNAAAEWLSTHPSTGKRIRALAVAARLGAGEVDALCGSDDPGPHYELPPQEDAGPIFTPAWQKINAGVYGWTALLGASGVGLSVAWLLDRLEWVVAVQLLAGIALGCLLTK